MRSGRCFASNYGRPTSARVSRPARVSSPLAKIFFAAVVFLFSADVPLRAQNATSTDSCAALLNQITDRDPAEFSPDGRYRPRWWDIPPPDAAKFATDRVPTKEVSFVLLPNDAASFERVFDRPPSLSEIGEMQRQRLDRSSPLPTATEASLAAALQNSDAAYVTFIGHNDQGQLRFPDGSKMRLFDIARICTRYGKRAIFLSCKAEGHIGTVAAGAVGELEFGQALELSTRLRAYLAQQSLASLADVQTFLRNEERAVGFSYKVKYLVTRLSVGAGASSILALVVYVIDKLAVLEPAPAHELLTARRHDVPDPDTRGHGVATTVFHSGSR
jgi:hypothetical protein